MVLITINYIAIFFFFLAIFTSRLENIFRFDNTSLFSVIFILFGFFSYKRILNNEKFLFLILIFVAIIFLHFSKNILSNGYLHNPTQYRDYSKFLFIAIPLLVLSTYENKNFKINYIFLFFFTIIALITNSRSAIYLILLIYIIHLLLSPKGIKNSIYSFFCIMLSFTSFLGMVNIDAYGDFINRISYGISSPSRLNEILPLNVNNAIKISNLNAVEPYNTHNVLFHLYIFVNKILAFFSLIFIIALAALNLLALYKYKLFSNLNVILLTFVFTYYLFIYCNVESANIWLYFFMIGLYFGFVSNLFYNESVIKIPS